MKKFYFALMALVVASLSFAQSNPVPQTIPYSQDFTSLPATSTTYPTGWQGWTISTSPGAVFNTATPTGDRAMTASGTANNNAGALYNYNGKIGYLNTGSLDLTIALALDASGKNNIQVQYDVMTIRNPYDGTTNTRINEITLQYRVGTTGAFTTLTGIEYQNNTSTQTTSVTTPQNAQTKTITLPSACDNQPVIQLRWASRQVSGGGSRPSFAVDNIVVNAGASATTVVNVGAGNNMAEPSTNGTFTLSLSSPAPAGGVVVSYTLSGSATPGSDYTDPQSGSVTIPQNASSGVVTLNVVNDNVQESLKNITITLTGASNGYTVNPSANSATINLTDEDLSNASFNGNYEQHFDALVTSGTGDITTTPTGWTFLETGTNANQTYAAADGSNISGNTYSFGTGTNAERAFGTLRSNSLTPMIGALFTNTTGATITSLQISYTGEQWRLGALNRDDRLDFQYSLNATSLSTGTWVNVDGLDFIALNSSGTVGPLDGNAVGNSRMLTSVINGLSIPNGATFAIRWTDFDVSGSEDGLGVDDFFMTLGCTPPTNQPTVLNLTPSLQSISGTFTPADAGTTAADAYLVLVSTSSTLSEMPVSGNVYAGDDVVGNARVVSIAGTSFTASGLAPATTYYFYVFSTSSASTCYNIGSPLTGSISTTSPPACTPPSTQVSNLTTGSITGTSIDLNYTRGNGDNVLIIARPGSAVDATIYNGVNYAVGSEVGSGNFVVYNGPASSFSYTGLSQNTTYHFALYEYFSATPCYTTPALTGNFTTLCTDPVNVSSLNGTAGNNKVTVSWSNPSTACYDEIIVVASNATVPGTGDNYTGTANSTYGGGGPQVVYRGTAGSVTVTGLTNGSNYFFKVFTRKGSSYSAGVQISVIPFDPSSTYTYLFGNIHAHSSFSDGNKDDLSKTPDDDYAFARDALCMDFLGISEHNHGDAGLSKPDYAQGFNEANSMNLVTGPGGNSIVTLWGMEWGTISSGGHVLIYGFDNQVIGWEPSNYDIFVAKGDYANLFVTVNNRPGALATLAHPKSDDFGNIAATYSTTADAAVVGVAVESGPAFSTSKTYNDFPSSLSYLSYFRTMLAKGYRLAPQMDQDNHNMTFGTANTNRMVVLTTGKTREALMEGIRSMRYYASQDCNVRIDYRTGSASMGSQVFSSTAPSLSLTVTDPDAEAVTSIELWGGRVGGSVPASPIKTYSNVSSLSFTSSDAENVQPENTTWYYYALITQEDGNKIVTAPIWINRAEASPLPVVLSDIKAKVSDDQQSVLVTWVTSSEIQTKEFGVQRSVDNGRTWTTIGVVSAAGTSAATRQYSFRDQQPFKGVNLYKLKQVDLNNSFTYSRIVSASLGRQDAHYYSVYPNPARGVTYVNATSLQNEPVTVYIHDVSGKELLKKNYTVNSTAPVKLDLSAFKSGTYFIRVVGNTVTTTEKIVLY